MSDGLRERIVLKPVTTEDEQFLLTVYASSRQKEMSLVAWSNEQKRAFLKMQLAAQQQHYQARFPEATFNLIEFDNQPVGRFYVAELQDEIRIIDIAVLPDYRRRGIGTALISETLTAAEIAAKPVQIYLDFYSEVDQLFSALGFWQISVQDFHRLWRWEPAGFCVSQPS